MKLFKYDSEWEEKIVNTKKNASLKKRSCAVAKEGPIHKSC